MERTLSVEEKIRRAEEIYNRRNGYNYYDIYLNKKNKNKSPSLMRRLIKQIIVCSLIYCMFYVVSNREYYLSKEFLEKVQEIASKNEVLNNTYNFTMSYLKKYIDFSENENEKETKEEQNTVNEQSVENVEENKEENIGGAEEMIKSSEKTQEEEDIEYIKSKISFILPLVGKISSTFGLRNPTTVTVPKYHTGIDIAASKGTVIKSATDGIVLCASSQGDYGNHYKIQIEDIILVYAHCQKLYLHEGEKVHQGQEIAEVGSTRKFNRTTSSL